MKPQGDQQFSDRIVLGLVLAFPMVFALLILSGVLGSELNIINLLLIVAIGSSKIFLLLILILYGIGIFRYIQYRKNYPQDIVFNLIFGTTILIIFLAIIYGLYITITLIDALT